MATLKSNTERYYVRVWSTDSEAFERHLTMYDLDYTVLSVELGFGTTLYVAHLTPADAVLTRLSFPVLDFVRTDKWFIETWNNRAKNVA